MLMACSCMGIQQSQLELDKLEVRSLGPKDERQISATSSYDMTSNSTKNCEVVLNAQGTSKKEDKQNDKIMPARKSPAPVLKKQNYTGSDKKDVGLTFGPAEQKASPGTPTAGPGKIKRLFRRHSATRVCPNDTTAAPQADAPDKDAGGGAEGGGGGGMTVTTAPASPRTPQSPSENDHNHVMLFSGTLTPVSCREPHEAEEGFLSANQLYNSMNDGQLSPYLLDPSYLLILDARSLSHYRECHIATARHVSELESPGDVEPMASYTMVILYDYKGLSHSLKDSLLSRTLKQLSAYRSDVFVLAGGYDAFSSKHPYFCTERVPRTERERQVLISNYPSIVVEDKLYLGRGDQAASTKVIQDLGITHVVNVTKDHPNPFEDRLKYLRLELDDENTANLLHKFPMAIEFLVGALNEGGCAMVHCNLGVSRSSTVLIAFLMYTRRWTLGDAYHYLKERRPVIHPNRGFFQQLSRFEEILFGKKYTGSELWIRS